MSSENVKFYCKFSTCKEVLSQDPYAPEGHRVCAAGHKHAPDSRVNLGPLTMPAREWKLTELAELSAMLRRAKVGTMTVQDMDDPSRQTVTVENLDVEDDMRIDVEFIFSHGRLMSVRARRG